MTLKNCDDVLIDKNVIGSAKHLFLSNDGVELVDRHQDSSWILRTAEDHKASNDILTLLRLEHVSLNAVPKEEWVTLARSLKLQQPPWARVMPTWAYRDFLKRLVTSTREALAKSEKAFYVDTWVPCGRVYEELLPFSIDIESIERSSHTQDFHTFLSSMSGDLVQPPIYNRFGTHTGRSTIKSGANVISLKRELRKFIVPRKENAEHKLCCFDFSSLETRVVLYSTSNDNLLLDCDNDVYAVFAKDESFQGLCREKTKVAVISTMYGVSAQALSLRLELPKSQVVKMQEYIDVKLRVKSLYDTLHSSLMRDGFIRNPFGRKVIPESSTRNSVINAYAQSTGADVVNHGFLKMIPTLKKFGIEPHFFVYDALYASVPIEHIDRLSTLRVHVPKFSNPFIVQLTA